MTQIKAIVSSEVEKACQTSRYQYNGYDADIRLMVLDGELKAYVVADPNVTTKDSEGSVYVPDIRMIVDVASIVTE